MGEFGSSVFSCSRRQPSCLGKEKFFSPRRDSSSSFTWNHIRPISDVGQHQDKRTSDWNNPSDSEKKRHTSSNHSLERTNSWIVRKKDSLGTGECIHKRSHTTISHFEEWITARILFRTTESGMFKNMRYTCIVFRSRLKSNTRTKGVIKSHIRSFLPPHVVFMLPIDM